MLGLLICVSKGVECLSFAGIYLIPKEGDCGFDAEIDDDIFGRSVML